MPALAPVASRCITVPETLMSTPHAFPAILAGTAALVLAAVAFAVNAQEETAAGAKEARANLNRAVVLASDDVPAFAAPPPGFADESAGVRHGQTQEFSYESAVTNTRRKAMVYLPAGYAPDRRYPVLYLLHGIGGNEHEWSGYVRATVILDKLIASGQAEPMIVVMPNGRARADDASPSPDQTFTPGHIAAFSSFEADLLRSLVPAIEGRYSTLADAPHRAIAGLSMGGGQALNIGLTHLDTFGWVGGFSSAPNTKPATELLPDADAARRKLKLLYLSCGRQDGLISVSQSLHRALRDGGVQHIWHVDAHAHDRESWAENLHHFAQRVFR
jgi:enterochelin esterase-like enzyme